MCCRGESLQEPSTRCDIENSVHFVLFMTNEFKPAEFYATVAGKKLKKTGVLQEENCCCNLSLQYVS